MKKALFILICFWLPFSIMAQTYLSIPDSGATWLESRWSGGSCADYGGSTYEISEDGKLDTLGYTYIRLKAKGGGEICYSGFGGNMYAVTPFSNNPRGYFRNEAPGKVYYRLDFYQPEELLYDFNLSLGDTVSSYHNTFTTVCNIDTIILNGIPRKRIHVCVSNTTNAIGMLIEGVGGTRGFLTGRKMLPTFEDGQDLHCMSEFGIKTYPSNQAMCTLPDGYCGFSLSFKPDTVNYSGVPATVNFNNTTADSSMQWLWSFGDGQHSTAYSPTHIYDSAGYYQVELAATDEFGCTNTNAVPLCFICVGPPCQCNALFTIYPDTLTPGNYYGFNNSTGYYDSWQWSFGDGTHSTARYPVHTYAAPGKYNVCLTVGTYSPYYCRSTYCDSSFYVFKTESGLMSQLNILNPTGISEISISNFSFHISPNPASNFVTITTDEDLTGSTLTITDLTGRTVTQAKLATGNTQLSTEALPTGLYFVTVSNVEQRLTKKLVIEK